MEKPMDYGELITDLQRLQKLAHAALLKKQWAEAKAFANAIGFTAMKLQTYCDIEGEKDAHRAK